MSFFFFTKDGKILEKAVTQERVSNARKRQQRNKESAL